MPSIVVVGAQWGDEGKGKIVDLLAQSADMIVRFSGGDNAGHTVMNSQGDFSLHTVPSGIFCPGATCILGNGMVVNPDSLIDEIDALEAKDVDLNRLFISDKAHLVLPYHLMVDGLEEAARGDDALGTTKRGIGPAYSDKAARVGIRAGDLLEPDTLPGRLSAAIESKRAVLDGYKVEPLSLEKLTQASKVYSERLGPMIRPTEPMVNDALDSGKTVVFEGAQGALLDLDFGTYPYVTSSPTTALGVYVGAGLRPRALDCVLGVFKAYTTRVGAGPMPTELTDETGELIRQRAHEFGVTTGRPRRCGWFDAVSARYSVQINGTSAGALTRLDVLDDFPEIKICIGYQMDGTPVDGFPTNTAVLDRSQPVYETLPGWQTPTDHLRNFADLPENARGYIRRFEELVGCEMRIISVGPRREETIWVKPLF
jgi:adenylosuccinate synthase